MKACVLDASVVTRWWFDEADTSLSGQSMSFLRAHRAGTLAIHVPDLLLIEVGNAFWKLVRFSGWPLAAARSALDQLGYADLAVHASADLVAAAFEIAASHGITVYDAIYVCLAAGLDLPLFTADDRLVGKIGAAFPFVRSIA